MSTDDLHKIAVFQHKEIRKQLHDGEWWFVINDIILALTESSNPSQYLKNLRNRDEELSELFDPVEKGAVQIEPPLTLEFETPGGRQRLLSWNTEGIFRLTQSIPSKKAEPFKRWLARVGYERVQEIENPELAQKRMKATYRAKGLQRENLRDHMNDLELLFTQLGEAATTEIARTDKVQGMAKNRDAAKRGGAIAGTARKQLEQETGNKVVNPSNYLPKQKNKEIDT